MVWRNIRRAGSRHGCKQRKGRTTKGKNSQREKTEEKNKEQKAETKEAKPLPEATECTTFVPRVCNQTLLFSVPAVCEGSTGLACTSPG
jgi:hypothetical protein